MNFKIGDIVRLKSGGPLMTVTGANTEGEVWTCWFDDLKKENKGYYPADALAPDNRHVTPSGAGSDH